MRLRHFFSAGRATTKRLTPSRRLLAPVAAWLIALSPGYAGLATALPPAQRVLNDLSTPDQLQQLFESDKGKLRILALLSPT